MKNKKVLLTAGLAMLSIFSIATTSLFLKDERATQTDASFYGEISEGEVKNIYNLNETLTLKLKDVIYNGSTYRCNKVYIVFPDGSIKSGTNQILNQIGEYTIVYVAQTDSKTITAEEKIHVYQAAFSVGRDSSSTEFVDEIVCDKVNRTSGIATSLSEGDIWTFNKVINLNELNPNTPLIKYYTYTMSERASHVRVDALTYIVRVTDVYDPSNYFDIYNKYCVMNPGTGRIQQCFQASANGQTPTGLDDNLKTNQITYDGVLYEIYSGRNNFGTIVGNPYPGHNGIFGNYYEIDISNSDDTGYTYYYNYAKQTIHAQLKTKELVSDLDSPVIYPNVQFKGFTTGEVTISIRCEDYQESFANFEITEICGLQGDDLNIEYNIDEKAPVIKLENEVSDFYIAMNEEFEISKASAFDLNLSGEVEAQVFYDYEEAGEEYISLVDNKFTPTKPGVYTIVYTAKDSFGNFSKKTVNCVAVYRENNKLVNLEYNHISSGDAGSLITFEKPIVSSLNDGTYVRMYATYLNEPSLMEEIDVNNPTFFLKRVGNYKIEIYYGDISCEKVATYNLSSNASDNLYLENIYLPKYFIKDTKVTLDDNKVVLCDSEAYVTKDAKVYVNNDNAGYLQDPIDIKTFEVNASSTVQFKYVYENKVVHETEKLPVIDADFIDRVNPEKYFIGDFTNSKANNGYTFTSNKSNGNNELEFANILDRYTLDLEAHLSKGEFESFDVVLKDYYGKYEDFVFNYYYENNDLHLRVENYNISLGRNDEIIIRFDRDRSLISVGNGISIDDFLPTDFARCYVSFRFNNLSGESKIRISSFAGQIFNNNVGDRFSPTVSYSSIGGNRKINTEVTIKDIFPSDCLSPFLLSNQTLKVSYALNEDADYSYITATDGTLLDGSEDPSKDYTILLDKYGVYFVEVNYKDQAISRGTSVQNSANGSEYIFVEDYEAPVIIVGGGVNSYTIESISVNKEYQIHDFVVEDESSYTVSTYAVSPLNLFVTIKNRKIKPDVVGDWSIIYYVQDSNGNISIAQYTLRVK